jgi:uncharacterized protein DUF2612
MPNDPYHIDFVEQGLDEITSKHWTRANYRAFISAILKQFQPLMDACEEMMLWRDIDNAQGDALYKIAEIVGAPIINQDDLGGVTSDDPYEAQRVVIRAKIIKNHSHGFTPEIQRSLATLFGTDFAFVQNNFNMSFDVNVAAILTPVEIQLIAQYDILPRPAGVRIRNFVYWDSTLPVFGFAHQPDTFGFGVGYFALRAATT